MRKLALLLLFVSLGTFGQFLRPANVAMHWSPNAIIPPVEVEADVSSWCFTGSNGDDCTDNFDFTTEYGNPTYATASTPAGYMVELDGNDCLIETDVNYIHDQGAASAFTLSGWFRSDSLAVGEVTAINRTWLSGQTILLLELASDGDYLLRLRAGTTTDTYISSEAARYVAARWTFFAITYDNSTDDVVLFVDNTTDQSSLSTVIDTTHSTGGDIAECDDPDCWINTRSDSLIGCRNGSSNGTWSNYFTGDIADIRLFDSALSQSQIEAIRDDQ